MKKIFFFAAAMLAAVSMNAETVFSWADNIGTTSVVGNKTNLAYTVKIQTNTQEVTSIAFEASYLKEGAYNYLNIIPNSGKYLAGDVIKIEYCFNNSDNTKIATVGLYTNEDQLLAESPQGINARLADGISTFAYVLTSDVDTIRVARGVSGNTRTCVTKLEVVRGESIEEKTLNPMFSVGGGTYFDPFKLGISTPEEGATIYCRLNETGDFAAYSDSIEINEYEKKIVVEAYATREGASNSDTVKATYELKHFIARPVFEARAEYNFAGIKEGDIKILSGANGEMTTYTMDGKDCPSINYIHDTNIEGKDSALIVAINGREDVTFRYKNSANKANVFKFAEDFTQLDSKNFEMWIENVKSGDTIVFVVTAKGSAPQFDVAYSTASYLNPYMPDDDTDPCFTDGLVMTAPDAKVEDNYSGWQDLVYVVADGGHSKVRIKEIANGCRIAKILVGAYRGEDHAVDNVNATIKAVKTIENGQLVIIKNGVRYNALGAQL